MTPAKTTTTKTKATGPKLPAASKAKKRTVKAEPAVDSLPTNPFVFEVLDLASKQRSAAKKVQVLKQYEHDSLKMVFIWNFDVSVITMLPPGEVPYGDLKEANVYKGTLSDNIAKEAELLVKTKDKKLEDLYKVTWDNVKAAYPDIQWGGRS